MAVRDKSNGRLTAAERKQFFSFLRRMVQNQMFSRTALAQYMAGPGWRVDDACGYPAEIVFQQYREMYEREGVASRVVSLFPSECWSVQPYVYETESVAEEDQTEFEKVWERLVVRHGIYTKLARLDEVSGIGHYGVLLIGTNDGLPLDRPFPGLNAEGEMVGDAAKEHELLYLMPFSEGEALIQEWEKNERSPRYGKPVYYNLTIANPQMVTMGMPSGKFTRVHWTRCLHVAEGCTTNDVVGTPRLKKVFNYVLNLRKILGGSAEMFWHGGFPGTSFEVPPDLAASVELDKEELRQEIEQFFSGFKRYFALKGVQAKQLQPNIADPSKHVQMQLMAIATSIEVPMRVLTGTEEARLASMQDSESWNRRIHRRHDIHVTPNILRPFVDRLINMGILPKPKLGYKVKWPDIYAISRKDLAEITGKLVRALGEYVRSGASKAFPFLEFLTMIMDFSTEEAERIIMAAQEAAETGQYDFMKEEEEPKPTQEMVMEDDEPREPPLGESRKVKIANMQITVNPTMRCQRDGKPGYKYGPTGKCYTYDPNDSASRKRALRKAKLQGAAIEITKRLQTMEEEAGDE